MSYTSTSQYSAETLMTILERPSTSLSQSVDMVMDTPDPEVILPGELRTVATRLCDHLAVTLPLHHSTPLEPPSSHETPTRFGTQQISPVSLQSQTPSEGSNSKHRPSTEVFICMYVCRGPGVRPRPRGGSISWETGVPRTSVQNLAPAALPVAVRVHLFAATNGRSAPLT